MAFNGSGSFSRTNGTHTGANVWNDDENAGTPIRSDLHDTHDQDLADGLSNCVTKDGQTTITANLPMSGFKHTNVADATARNQYLSAGDFQDGDLIWADAGGTADAITATYSPAITALVDGMECRVRAASANATTTPSFSPNGLTARTIVKLAGAALVANDIAGDGHDLILRYDATNTQWNLLNPATGTTEVSQDATPQLGGDLDANGNNILFDDATGIHDSNDNQQLIFQETASAVNHLEITNAATGTPPTNSPSIAAVGDDSNVDIILTPKGTGSVNLQDVPLKRPDFIDYGETVNAIGDFGGGTQDIDLELGNVVTATVSTSAVTFTFSNPPASGTCGSFTLVLTDGQSQGDITWPTEVDWANGNAPTLTSSGVDVLTFFTVDGGTIWYGFSAGLDMQ